MLQKEGINITENVELDKILNILHNGVKYTNLKYMYDILQNDLIIKLIHSSKSENKVIKILKSTKVLFDYINNIMLAGENKEESEYELLKFISENEVPKKVLHALFENEKFLRNVENIFDETKVNSNPKLEIILQKYMVHYFKRRYIFTQNENNDVIQNNFNESKNYPLLDKYDEDYILRNNEKISSKAKDYIINCNIRLVIYLIDQVNVPYDKTIDHLQVGYLGLLRAIDKFDIDKNIKFSTYAYKWIKGMITNHVYDNEDIVRIPKYSQDKYLKKIYKMLYDEDLMFLTKGIIIEKLGISEEEVHKYLKVFNMKYMISLDCVLEFNNYNDEIVTNTNFPSEEIKFENLREIIKEFIIEVVKNEMQIDVLLRRYGFVDNKIETYESIAQVHNTSKQYIHTLEKTMIKKLNKAIENPKYRKYKDNLNIF